MILWILFSAFVVIEIVFTPLYLKALWPEKCFKSLVYKMICSTAFVGIGVVSMLISGNTSRYALTMMIGLVLGWIGDYFLHAKPTNAYFVTGFISFLLGHIAYIIAYVNAIPVVAPDYVTPNIAEIGLMIFMLGSAVFAAKMLKVKFNPKPMKYAIMVYSVILVFMFVKAFSLGYCYYTRGGEYGVVAFLVLAVGSLFFVLSDASLGAMMFGGQKKNYPLKIFNIITYFGGQVMLASSILFINA